MIFGPQRAIGTLISYLVLGGFSAHAQAPETNATPSSHPPVDAADSNTVQELKRLREEIDELKELNEDLQEDVEDLFLEQHKPIEKATALNLLNPQITVFASGAARGDSRRVLSAQGARIDDKLFLRTVEFDFRSAIDPYADGVVMLALEDEAGTGFEADLEEVYVVIKRLPVLETAPLGLKLKLGRFRAGLGSVNRMHMHDLPWVTRPLPIVKFLGTEHGSFFESGFNPEGVDAEFLLPELIPGVVMEVNLDVLDAHDIAITAGNDGWDVGLLGRFNLFFTAAESHDFNLGFSGYYEGGAQPSRLLVGDFLYKWKPQHAGEFRSLVLGGEVFHADRRNFVDPTSMSQVAKSAPLGFFAFAQYQLNWHLYAGARYDFAQEINDDSLSTEVLAAYATYYTSEFLRFRLGYEHRKSDIEADDGLHSVFFDVNFVMGSHPTEPYWVNR